MIHITLPIHLPEILEVFKKSIQKLGINHYNQEQLTVWESSATNREKWIKRIEDQYFIHHEKEGDITGFASLEGKNYIDLMYTHPDYTRQGTAKILLSNLEDRAKQLGADKLLSDVSLPAKDFFENQGFEIQKQNYFQIDGVEISNFRMVKNLP